MKNLNLFCLSLNPLNLKAIKKLKLIPVGLGDKKFSNEWFEDKVGENISSKNKFYGEYTFHYWLWKNYLDKLDDKWIGFCQYRKFWANKAPLDKTIKNFGDLENNIIQNIIPENLTDYDVILGEPIKTNHFRFSKFVKHNLKNMVQEPSLFFYKNKRNIRFQFYMMHGKGNLDKAIELLDKKDKPDFQKFVLETSFNPHNMFICKSKNILIKYYEDLFPWLEKCENIFGFDNLKGYGQQRMYGFLAERYLSYWFKKHTKHFTLPIIFNDLNNYNL